MNINRFFPLVLHVILAGGAIGLAVGINSVQPFDPVKAYTATGFAAGFGITAVIRGLIFVCSLDFDV